MDGAKPYGERVIAARMSLNGQRIDRATSYRLTGNNYLAVGGDGFTVLKDGSEQRVGVCDVDALYGYFQANSPDRAHGGRPDRANELNARHLRGAGSFPAAGEALD